MSYDGLCASAGLTGTPPSARLWRLRLPSCRVDHGLAVRAACPPGSRVQSTAVLAVHRQKPHALRMGTLAVASPTLDSRVPNSRLSRLVPPTYSRPAAALLAVATLWACASGALAAGQHLPLEGCCPSHAKTITQLQEQLKVVQEQLTLLQRSVQPLVTVRQQLVQVGCGTCVPERTR